MKKFNLGNLFTCGIIIVIFTLVSGCHSKAFAKEKEVKMTVVSRTVRTTTVTNPDGTTSETKEVVEESKTDSGAKHDEKMAKIDSKTTIEVAKANRPKARSCPAIYGGCANVGRQEYGWGQRGYGHY